MSVKLCCEGALVNSFLVGGDFFRLLIPLQTVMDPDSGSGSKLFNNLILVPEIIFENINFEKSQQMTTKA